MNNHYHIVIETPEGNLLKVMHGINSGIQQARGEDKKG